MQTNHSISAPTARAVLHSGTSLRDFEAVGVDVLWRCRMTHPLSAAKVARPATLPQRSAPASRNEMATDVAGTGYHDGVEIRGLPRPFVPRSENNEFQRGHNEGYSAGVRDGMQAAKRATPAPVKFSAGRPEPRKDDQECWMGHEWGAPNDAACDQRVRQVAVTVSVLVSLPKADDCTYADFVRAGVQAIQKTLPQAAILLDNDTKQTALNPMVDGGNVIMPDFFCKSLEPKHDAQCDFAARFGGGA